MMPSDEEIINWSILENEIFWDELIDDGLDNEVLWMNNEEWEEFLQNENEDLVENDWDVDDLDVDDWKSEVDVEVVD